MRRRLLLGLLLSALLCGCASNSPYSETVIDTNKGTQQTALPEAPPVYDRPIYTPGASGMSGSHF
jgi:type IV pilus biogenesis protein CpaD/CtpE